MSASTNDIPRVGSPQRETVQKTAAPLNHFLDNFDVYRPVSNTAWQEHLDSGQLYHRALLDCMEFVPPEAFAKIMNDVLERGRKDKADGAQ